MSERLDMAKALYLERCAGIPGAPAWNELSSFTRNEYVRVARSRRSGVGTETAVGSGERA